MKLRKLALAPIAAAAMMAFSMNASAAVGSWILNVSGITGEIPGTGNYGTVQVTEAGANDVNVLVTLNAQGFVNTGSHTSFSWSLNDAPDSVTISTSGFVNAIAPITNNGFGTFTNGISCVGCDGGNPFPGPLEFTIHDGDGINLSSFIGSTAPPGTSGWLFAADILTNAGRTGAVATNTPAIPEPETYAMMLAGLGLLGFVARRRRQGLGGNVVPA